MSPSDDSINKKTCTPWAEKMKMKLLKWNLYQWYLVGIFTFRWFNKWKRAHSTRWAEHTNWKVKVKAVGVTQTAFTFLWHGSISTFRDGVETCTPWVENTTQQIDLAFNIFFMVYFFIRVSFRILFLAFGSITLPIHILYLRPPVHCCFGQVLVHARSLLLCRLLHHPTLLCIHLPG